MKGSWRIYGPYERTYSTWKEIEEYKVRTNLVTPHKRKLNNIRFLLYNWEHELELSGKTLAVSVPQQLLRLGSFVRCVIHTGTVRNEYDSVGVLALQLVMVTTGAPFHGTTGRLSSSTRGNVTIGPVLDKFLRPRRRRWWLRGQPSFPEMRAFLQSFSLWSVPRHRKQTFFSLANCQQSSTPLSWNYMQNHTPWSRLWQKEQGDLVFLIPFLITAVRKFRILPRSGYFGALGGLTCSEVFGSIPLVISAASTRNLTSSLSQSLKTDWLFSRAFV